MQQHPRSRTQQILKKKPFITILTPKKQQKKITQTIQQKLHPNNDPNSRITNLQPDPLLQPLTQPSSQQKRKRFLKVFSSQQQFHQKLGQHSPKNRSIEKLQLNEQASNIDILSTLRKYLQDKIQTNNGKPGSQFVKPTDTPIDALYMFQEIGQEEAIQNRDQGYVNGDSYDKDGKLQLRLYQCSQDVNNINNTKNADINYQDNISTTHANSLHTNTNFPNKNAQKTAEQPVPIPLSITATRNPIHSLNNLHHHNHLPPHPHHQGSNHAQPQTYIHLFSNTGNSSSNSTYLNPRAMRNTSKNNEENQRSVSPVSRDAYSLSANKNRNSINNSFHAHNNSITNLNPQYYINPTKQQQNKYPTTTITTPTATITTNLNHNNPTQSLILTNINYRKKRTKIFTTTNLTTQRPYNDSLSKKGNNHNFNDGYARLSTNIDMNVNNHNNSLGNNNYNNCSLDNIHIYNNQLNNNNNNHSRSPYNNNNNYNKTFNIYTPTQKKNSQYINNNNNTNNSNSNNKNNREGTIFPYAQKMHGFPKQQHNNNEGQDEGRECRIIKKIQVLSYQNMNKINGTYNRGIDDDNNNNTNNNNNNSITKNTTNQNKSNDHPNNNNNNTNTNNNNSNNNNVNDKRGNNINKNGICYRFNYKNNSYINKTIL